MILLAEAAASLREGLYCWGEVRGSGRDMLGKRCGSKGIVGVGEEVMGADRSCWAGEEMLGT